MALLLPFQGMSLFVGKFGGKGSTSLHANDPCAELNEALTSNIEHISTTSSFLCQPLKHIELYMKRLSTFQRPIGGV